MAARPDTAPLTGIHAVIGVSSVLLVTGVGLAAYTVVPPWNTRVGRISRALLSLGAVSLIAFYAVCIGMAVDIKNRGGYYMLGAWDGSLGHAYFTAITLLHGLFTFLTLAAMRTLFYELTSNVAFVSHRVAKRVIIGFDVIILGAGFALLWVTAFTGGPCCEGSFNTAGDMVMAGVFDATASYGFHYFVFAGEVLTIISSIFARKWSRRYDLGVPMANAMLTVMTPLIVFKTILLIITTIVNFDGEIHGTDYLTFYVSVPWRFAQVATAGALAWIIRTRPVRSGATDPTPKIQSTSRVIDGDLEK